jgi:hypothetical protein
MNFRHQSFKQDVIKTHNRSKFYLHARNSTVDILLKENEVLVHIGKVLVSHNTSGSGEEEIVGVNETIFMWL